jgi:hypothetical protein
VSLLREHLNVDIGIDVVGGGIRNRGKVNCRGLGLADRR